MIYMLGLIVLMMSCASPYERKISKIYGESQKEIAVFQKNFSPEIDKQAISNLQKKFETKGKPKVEQAEGPVCVRAYWGDTVINGSVYFYFQDGEPKMIERFESGGSFRQSMGNLLRHNSRPPKRNKLAECIEANHLAATK